jgi:hypothetical protein
MKKTLIVLVFGLILAALPVLAGATSLVCDPQAGVTSYVITGLPAPLDVNNDVPIAAQPDGSLKLDVNSCPVGGPYSLEVSACGNGVDIDAGVWAGSCSTSANFTFSRPGAPSTPKNTRLVK